ncbi:hypothetical protein V2I28_04925 [Campylobacter sp. CX2-4080-23]|uniref:hypothetical protein n=1 Tax=Campylobacter porcelli TaxID=1660073 RepID=UPI002EA78A14|nr:hypothetical protein [Campylobacter sp. CX2-4080-23]
MRYIYLLLLLLTNLYSYSYNVITSDTFNPVKDDTYNPNDILSSKKRLFVTDYGDYIYENSVIDFKVNSNCYDVLNSKNSPCFYNPNGHEAIMLDLSDFSTYSMAKSVNYDYDGAPKNDGAFYVLYGSNNFRDPWYTFYMEGECGSDCPQEYIDEMQESFKRSYDLVMKVSDRLFYIEEHSNSLYQGYYFAYFYPYQTEESINNSGLFDGMDNFFTSVQYKFTLNNSYRHTCPVGSKFNPDTGLCFEDCTDYDVSDSEFKFQFNDGKCLVVTGATSNYDIAKAYCEFKDSNYTITGADPYAPGSSSIMYFCDNYINMIQLPDDLFQKAPEFDNKDDNTDNSIGGSTDNGKNGSTTNQGDSETSSGGGSSGGSSSESNSTNGNNPSGGSSSGSNSGDNDDETTGGGNGSSESNSTNGNNPGGGSGSGGVGTDGTDGNGADQGGDSEGEGIGNTDKEAVEGALGGLGGLFDDVFDSFFDLGNSSDEMLANLENSVNSAKDSLKPFGSISATTVTTCPLDFSYSNPYPINFSIDLCSPLYSVNGLVYSIIFLSILSLSVIFFIKILIMLLATF